MLNPSEVVMIQTLAEQGATISAIARRMGIDRKTVRAALRRKAGEMPDRLRAAGDGAPGRKAAPSVLDPYKDFVKARLAEEEFTAQRLFQDIQAQGYRGSYNLVKRFVAPLREAQRQRAVVRFETLPGQQAQVDWGGSFGSFMVDGVKKRVWCFSMILGYSRYHYIEFTLSQNLVAFLSCHARAFQYFQGVPAEALYDNLKTAVLSHVGRVVALQTEFAAFAAAYGFIPRVCAPGRPQTKGKVERPFPYIRGNFFLGRSFRDLADLNAQARGWLEGTANRRIHGTTQERPAERFAREKGHLRRLPDKPVPVAQTVFRSATRDCVISYEGNSYSVPHRYAAREDLRVEVTSNEVRIHSGADLVATHALCWGKRRRIVDPKHFEGLKPQAQVTPTVRRVDELRALGPAAAAFVDGLVRTQTGALAVQLFRVEELLLKMGPDLLLKAMARAAQYRAFDADTLANLCRKLRPELERPTPLKDVMGRIVARLVQGQVELRSLSEYDRASSDGHRPSDTSCLREVRS